MSDIKFSYKQGATIMVDGTEYTAVQLKADKKLYNKLMPKEKLWVSYYLAHMRKKQKNIRAICHHCKKVYYTRKRYGIDSLRRHRCNTCKILFLHLSYTYTDKEYEAKQNNKEEYI